MQPQPPAPLRVLIVEDNTLVALGLNAALQRLDHHVTAHASTAPDALASSPADPPDLVLLDRPLAPAAASDGLDPAAKLTSPRPGTPLLVISAYSDPDLVHRATAAGVFGYLVKPVTPETLAA